LKKNPEGEFLTTKKHEKARKFIGFVALTDEIACANAANSCLFVEKRQFFNSLNDKLLREL